MISSIKALILPWFLQMRRRFFQKKIAMLEGRSHLQCRGNPHHQQVALTFDDGPSPDYTPQILAILQKYGVMATFFCVGQQITALPDLIKQEHLLGHLVANHSWSHLNLALLPKSFIRSQLARTSDTIQQVTGERPTFFRPPYGDFRLQVLKQANHLNMRTVLWNMEPEDWTKPGVDIIASRILNGAKNGSIILLHDGRGDRSQTVAALPSILEGLQQRGFEFVTLEQLVDDRE